MRHSFLFAVLASSVMFLGACSTAPQTASDRATLHNDSSAALADFKAHDSSVDNLLAHSYGYAIFPSVGKGAVGVGAAYGTGEVYEQGNRVGHVDMTQATVGVALGGQNFAELIVFENGAALERFKAGQLEFAADATAVAIKDGAGAAAKFNNGTATFIYEKGGLMADAAVGGQKFNYQPL